MESKCEALQAANVPVQAHAVHWNAYVVPMGLYPAQACSPPPRRKPDCKTFAGEPLAFCGPPPT
eukprot:4874102-Alexandrium_andersonii.AAC.1